MQTTENLNKRLTFVDTFNHPTSRSGIDKKKWANLILIMGIFFSIACLMPLITAPVASPRPIFDAYNTTEIIDLATDDYAYITSANNFPLFNQAAIASLCLLPTMDIFIDLLPVHWFFYAERTVVDNKDMPNVIRLTAQERALFIIGLLAMSEVVFKSVVHQENRLNIFTCCENVSTIFTVLPIISFLCRTSSIFTPINTILISLLVCIGSLLSSCITLYPSTATNEINFLNAVTSGLMDAAAGLFFIICVISTVKYFMQPLPGISDNRISWKDKEEINEERFRTFVIAAHMFTTMVELILNGVWYWYITSSAKQLGH